MSGERVAIIDWLASIDVTPRTALIDRLELAEQGLGIKDDLIAVLRESEEGLSARVRELEEAVTNASYCLDPNQGEHPDASMAYRWLRTTYPPDHPNYVDPTTLPPGFASPRFSDGP